MEARELPDETRGHAGGVVDVALENFLSVLDAERSVYAAEDQLVRGEKTTAVTLIAVYKALGGGWSPEAPSS